MLTSLDLKTPVTEQFITALVAINDPLVMQKFLTDVMTKKEISEIGLRLEAARMLQNGEKYTEIIKKTKLSSRTVARISSWIHNGASGYSAALAILDTHDHTRPVDDVVA